SHLVPGGTVAGTALGYRLLDAQGVSYTDATFALGAQGIGSALVLNVIFWAALIITIPLHGFGPNLGYLYRTAALVGVLLLSLAGGLIFFLTIGQQRASRVIRWLAKRIPFLDSVRFERVLRQLADHLAALAKDRSLLVRAIAWAATNWGLDAASLWVFMRAFGDSVLVPYLLVAYGLAYVLAAIPITPGGLGIVEYVLIAILQGFGFKNAALGVLCYRLVNFLLPIPVGGISYLSLTVHKAVTDSRAESPAGAIERNSMRPSNRISGIRGDIKDELREAVVIARRDSEHLDQWAHRYGVSSPVHLNREPRHSATEQVHPDQADRPADPPDSDDGSSTGP
ncbi:MAG TPA: YbhN family protein, partial [Acidimicrobiales bacterium]|nr:YbhN family protein [Acidimicrobiales bacterium]